MERYFFWLNADKFIYATFIAMNDADLEYAKEMGFPEVSREVFSQASPLSQFIDGKLIPPPEPEPYQPYEPPAPVDQQPFVLRYFVELDKDDYIIGTYIGFTQIDLDNLLSKGWPEIPESEYKKIGSDSKLVNGSVVQGEHREPILSPEANAAIRDARITRASEMISVLIDATDPDIVDEVDPADVALLKKWRQYRVALTKIDVNGPVWPTQPA